MSAITPGEPGLAILGLPLLNSYFIIIDGEANGGKGVVQFATAAGEVSDSLAIRPTCAQLAPSED